MSLTGPWTARELKRRLNGRETDALQESALKDADPGEVEHDVNDGKAQAKYPHQCASLVSKRNPRLNSNFFGQTSLHSSRQNIQCLTCNMASRVIITVARSNTYTSSMPRPLYFSCWHLAVEEGFRTEVFAVSPPAIAEADLIASYKIRIGWIENSTGRLMIPRAGAGGCGETARRVKSITSWPLLMLSRLQ